MPHSNQMREFTLSHEGILIKDVYLGASGILTGSARIAQEAKDAAKIQADQLINEGRKLEMESQRQLKIAQIAAIEAGFAVSQSELMRQIEADKIKAIERRIINEKMSHSRQADVRIKAVDQVEPLEPVISANTGGKHA